MIENKNQTKIKFMVPFVIGILVSASIIGVVTLLPIFQSNMLVYFFFTNPNGNFSNSNILPTVVEISDEGGGGEAVTLAAHSSQFCSGTSIFEHHGTIEITTYTSDQKSQTLSVVIPSVSAFDMINHNCWEIGFEWNSATHQWQQQSPVTFL